MGGAMNGSGRSPAPPDGVQASVRLGDVRVGPRARASYVTASVLVVVSAIAACKQSSSDSSASDNEKDRATAREYYVARVHPTLGTCLGCHAAGTGPRFMAEQAED